MTIEEFVDSNLETLANQYLNNARFTTMETVLRALSPRPEEELDVVAAVLGAVRKKIEEHPTKYLPRKCCATCWGPCGRQWQNLSRGFCDDTGTPFGMSCDQYSSVKEFGRRPIVIERTNKSRANGIYSQQETLQLEDGLVRIRRTVRNNNTGRILKTRSFDKLFVGDTAKFIRRFLRITRGSNNVGAILNGYRTSLSPEECTVKHGIPLVKGETIEAYVNRVAGEVRKRLEATTKESYDMSYNDAVEFVKSQLVEDELAVLNACKSFEEFLCLAFPYMSIWQVVESLKQEPLLN